MKKSSVLAIFLSVFIFLVLVNTGYSPVSIGSSNYKIFFPSVYSGGVNTTSSNFMVTSTIAQASTGNASSANYAVQLGRFQMLTVPTIILNVTFYPQEVWWNEPVNASGTITAIDSSPISGSVVNITMLSRSCYGTSEASGIWSCNFTAPNSLGDYSVTATALDSDGIPVRTENSFSVVLNYGPQPPGSTDRAVYETPILIQDPSGRITKAIARVLVWRG